MSVIQSVFSICSIVFIEYYMYVYIHRKYIVYITCNVYMLNPMCICIFIILGIPHI